MGNNNLSAKIIFTALFIYAVLFEFILPPVKIIPLPSELPNVLISLVKDYHLISALAGSLSVVTIAILISAALLFLFSGPIARIVDTFKNSLNSIRGIRYATFVSLAAIFALWFGESFAAEIISVFLFSFFNLFFFLIDKSTEVNRPYIDAALGLKIPENKIYKEVYFKSLLPLLRDASTRMLLTLLGFSLIYEIFAVENLGAIFKMIIIYSDYSALFIFVIILWITFFVLNWLIKIIIEKTIFWNNG